MTRRRCGKPRRRCAPPATRTGCHDRGSAARAGHPVVAAELPGGTSMAMSSFGELAEHVGHEVADVPYGNRGPPLAEAQFRRLEELIGRQPERFKDWAPSFHFALPLTTEPNSSPAVAYAREQALPHQVEIVAYWP